MKQEQFMWARPLSQEAQELLAMAQYIREHGWCQFNYFTPSGRACVAGAKIGTIGYGRSVGMDKFRDYIGGGSVSYWNDAPDRTVEQVISALEAAALS